nr:annetocin receptor-like [Lytechinus pictus]
MLALRYILAVLIRSISMILGIPGNGLIIIVYCKKKRKTGTDVFILGLAVVDFVVCLSFPVKIYSYVTSQFTNDALCKLMHFVVFWNTYIGVFLTTIITVDRFIAVCKPMKKRVSPKQAVVIVSASVILAAVSAIPSVALTGIVYYGPVSRCTYNADHMVYTQTITYLNDALFYSCLTVITVLYVLIWITVRRQARVRALKLGGINSVSSKVLPNQVSVMPSEAWEASDQGKSDRPTASQATMAKDDYTKKNAESAGKGAGSSRKTSAGSSNHHTVELQIGQGPSQGNQLTPPIRANPMQPRRKAAAPVPVVRTNNRTTVMIFTITVVFFLTWIPTKIWDYYPSIKFTWIGTDPVRYNIFYVSLLAINLNQVINPFIYSFVNVQFRRECVTVMRHIRQCRFS